MTGMRVKLYPTKVQLQQINRHIDTSRFIYNYMLAMKIESYTKDKTSIGKYTLTKLITSMKQSDEYTWLKDAHTQSLQMSIFNLDTAFKNFFRRVKQGGPPGFPKFKSKKNPIQSYQYAQYVKPNSNYTKMRLPNIGWVKCRGYRKELTGNIKTVTIKVANSGTVTASLLIDHIPVTVPNKNASYIGIDVGTNKFVTDSTGVMHRTSSPYKTTTEDVS